MGWLILTTKSNMKLLTISRNKQIINVLRNFSQFSYNNNLSIDKNRQKYATQNKYSSINIIQKRNFALSESIAEFYQTMSNSTPVAYIQQGLVEIHDFTGLPWWASIMLSTFLFRTLVTLPLAIYTNQITARIENITLEMPAIVKELKKETVIAMKQYNWDEKKARLIYNRSLKKQWNKLIVRDNCHPLKTLIILWGQIPLWICQSIAIRNLIYLLPNPNSLEAQIIATQLTVGGFLWIPNLTEIDSSLILPITLGILNLSIIELQTMTKKKETTRLQRYAANFFRILSVGMIPIAASVPSALCLYWVSSSAYGVLQNLILLSPDIRRKVGIPKVQSEIENPYQHLLATMKKRYGFIFFKS
ncbi:cytochrome c oxidase assembly protein COX18, mitochondrial [Condylostylus longicornis]|uniref:cytochrome c oxidase assembly protein COX18, mitochondrial n=1 Tax=Condylostylus longicornis TaxID=2530218 RepID=UPI00244E076D|nr:cytochrome c oxidase assembly protein COX18, mitochondrial [Condylostylus longicornis]XP_055384323.1 cytochrome c oxidase assembly protein COX18, mitochondrial [Condylostylus longicornis]XP_055384324.1 cytochrome c oxidase assembly protein COX18, mitochondrial [Condylostylus longicornis]